MLRRIFLTLALTASACAAHYTSGAVNGIDYWMSLDRAGVAGGVPYAINIQMLEGSASAGRLWVDGVYFGRVHSGDQVRVTREDVVLVNGEPRAPAAQD